MEKTENNLQIIEEMILTAKGNLSEGSIFYLIWGWLVLIAATINYVLLNFTDYPNHWIGWPFLMTLGGIVTGIIGYKKGKSKVVSTYAERAMKYLWIAFLITLFAVLYGTGIHGIEYSYSMIMLLYGLGTFVSGGILKFLPLKIGGIVSWICGLISFNQEFSDQLLLIMLAIIASYIIPGHLLANSKKEYV